MKARGSVPDAIRYIVSYIKQLVTVIQVEFDRKQTEEKQVFVTSVKIGESLVSVKYSNGTEEIFDL